jgi:hypothetical protein
MRFAFCDSTRIIAAALLLIAQVFQPGCIAAIAEHLNEPSYRDGRIEEGKPLNPYTTCKGAPTMRQNAGNACVAVSQFLENRKTAENEKLFSAKEVTELFGICLANAQNLSNWSRVCFASNGQDSTCWIVAGAALALKERAGLKERERQELLGGMLVACYGQSDWY